MERTIAAVATPIGEGGIGIIRISGEETLGILEKVFVSVQKNAPGQTSPCRELINRRLSYGFIEEPISGKRLDEVLAVYMRAPYTYTAEDVAEIHCHGGAVAVKKVLELVLQQGAYPAEPGEFTKRAFLNGRIDLSQAEAVIDVIKAKTDKTFDVALNQLGGEFSKKIQSLRAALTDVMVDVVVNIDYPDEDIEEITYDKLIKRLSLINDDITKLLSTADAGRILREGLAVAIIGKPNVGKSSLLNGLLREKRAIVTEIPGTTRDTIEEVINVRNIPVKLTDTAGIRKTDDIIEKIGIEKSKQSFNDADLVILVLDGNCGLTDEDREIIQYVGNRKAIVLINKSDLGLSLSEQEVKELLPQVTVIHTAVGVGEGIEAIEDEIEKMVYEGSIKSSESLMVTNARHKQLLEKSLKSIGDAIVSAKYGEALDIVEIDIRASYEFLGEIIGETVAEDIINEVFARFCLGK